MACNFVCPKDQRAWLEKRLKEAAERGPDSIVQISGDEARWLYRLLTERRNA